MTMKQHY